MDRYDSSTSANLNALEMYIEEAKKYTVLSNNETIELIKKAQEGDEVSRNKIVEHNLRLSIVIAKRYMNNAVPLLDLIQSGNLAIFRAIENFDVNSNSKFSTYLGIYIESALKELIAKEKATLYFSYYSYSTASKIKRFCDSFITENEREATNEDIRNSLGVKQEMIDFYRLIVDDKLVYSLDAPFYTAPDSDDCVSLHDFVGEEDENLNNVIDKLAIEQIMAKLKDLGISDLDIDIILYRNGLIDGKRHTLAEIGKKYGFTREWIRRLEKRNLKRIKSISKL